jgi:acetyl esterase
MTWMKARRPLREDDGAPGRRAGAGRGPVPLHPQVKTLLDGLEAAGGPSFDTLAPDEARVMFDALAGLDLSEEVARVDDRVAPGPLGDIPIRVYTPRAAVGSEPAGVLLWLHGGGWVVGNIETADATCRMLANRSGAVVVSVDYRLAPEHKAPAALDDCLAALTWTVENAELLGVTSAKLAIGGDSAGGNLAALVCQRSRDDFGPQIDFQLLVYPATDCTFGHPSVDENADGYFLTKAAMAWFTGHYLGEVDPKDPSVSPLYADRCDGLPPAMVITAEFDPLRDEGEAYALRLREAGVPVDAQRYDGQIHGFFSMTALLDDGRSAVDRAGAALRAALA